MRGGYISYERVKLLNELRRSLGVLLIWMVSESILIALAFVVPFKDFPVEGKIIVGTSFILANGFAFAKIAINAYELKRAVQGCREKIR